jgi:hypothetical protein
MQEYQRAPGDTGSPEVQSETRMDPHNTLCLTNYKRCIPKGSLVCLLQHSGHGLQSLFACGTLHQQAFSMRPTTPTALSKPQCLPRWLLAGPCTDSWH